MLVELKARIRFAPSMLTSSCPYGELTGLSAGKNFKLA